MAIDLQPRVGEWYQTGTGECFEVVAYDPGDETIEIQHADGAVEELDLETWMELELVEVEAPEDWSGSMDLMREDYLVDFDAPRAHDGYNFLDDVDRLG